MLFMLLIILIWSIFIVIFRRFNKKSFSLPRIILPLLIFSIMVTMDLGLNYVAASTPALNDGISLHGVWSLFIFRDEKWDRVRFYTYYTKAIYISLSLLILYMMSLIIKKEKM